MPAPDHIATDLEEICGTHYVAGLSASLVYPRPEKTDRKDDFVADDGLGLYYAGDFCSNRNPGFESAALSGLDVARHIVATSLQ